MGRAAGVAMAHLRDLHGRDRSGVICRRCFGLDVTIMATLDELARRVAVAGQPLDAAPADTCDALLQPARGTIRVNTEVLTTRSTSTVPSLLLATREHKEAI